MYMSTSTKIRGFPYRQKEEHTNVVAGLDVVEDDDVDDHGPGQ